MTLEEIGVEQFGAIAHDHSMAPSRIPSMTTKANSTTMHHSYHQHLYSHNRNHNQQSYNYNHQHNYPIRQQSLPSQINTISTQLGCPNSMQDKTNTIHQHQPRGDTCKSISTTTSTQNNNDTCKIDRNSSDHRTTSAISTIAIMRRHPMYDSLVLVKKYNPSLNSFTLEFPTKNVANNSDHVDINNHEAKKNEHFENGDKFNKTDTSCGRTKLVSVYLDGDDPIYQSQCGENLAIDGFVPAETGELVFVPMNGLLDRLDNYDRHGTPADGQVYAFAMGLKTAERFLCSSTEKEIQEAPPL